MTAERAAGALPVLIDGDADFIVWGRRPAERLRRGFERAGHAQFIDEAALLGLVGDVVLVRGDVALDAPIFAALPDQQSAALMSSEADDRVPVAAVVPAALAASVLPALRSGDAAALPPSVATIAVDELDAAYWQALRKRETPYALPLRSDRLAAIEWRIFMGTYKGATDFVTKWVWPRPAFHATKLCVRYGLTPNFVTAISLVAVIAAYWWFSAGWWAIGLIAAWLMTFLDTVDGKLARVTMTSSKFGNIFDHSIDLIHPPFWYTAWAMGLVATGRAESVLSVALIVIIAGYVLQRLMEGAAIYLFKIEIHIWRRIDTMFRQVTARRNPNLVLLTVFTLFGRPDLGFLAVAWWTAICLFLHGYQLWQAMAAKRRGDALHSWMTGPHTP